MAEIKKTVPIDDEDSLYEVVTGSEEILEWQRHILRGVQQELGKKALLDKIVPTTCYWLKDWGDEIYSSLLQGINKRLILKEGYFESH